MGIRRGFSENYETVGKDCFMHSSFVKELKKNERASDELMAQNSVIRFNSEYMDVLGNWYFFKTGGVLGLIVIIILCLSILVILGPLIIINADGSAWSYAAEFSLLVLIGFSGFMFHQIRRDFFHYTYYPMRFNRLERKVYVTNPNKKVSVYNWDDLTVTINNTSASFHYIRLSKLNENNKVIETFALPYITSYGLGTGTEIINHWEFFRRYMEEEPAESFSAIKEYYNIHGRKEKLSEILYALIMTDREYGISLEDGEPDNSNIDSALRWFPFTAWSFLARWVNERCNFLPPTTGHFQVDEGKYQDDPYNIDNKLKDFKRHIALTKKQKMLLWAWGPCSILLAYLFLEIMTYNAKGETVLLGYFF